MSRLLEERSREYREYIENYLKEWYARLHDEPQKQLFEAMEYSLLAGGKRLRPIFAFEFCRMCGADWKKAAPFAAAVEMIHTYSLIHDDLPCMDNDDERRGMPTSHKKFGETTAVLAGDCLQAEAFGAVCSADIGEAERFRCCRILSGAAGLRGICGGQYMDLSGCTASVEGLTATDLGKTASLMGAACALGAAAAGGTDTTVQEANAFGIALGMAFQCRDDILDGDGFCALLGAEECTALTEKYTAEAMSLLSAFEDAGFLRELTAKLAGRNT